SFHGTPEELEMLLDNHPEVELVQLQVNYLDWDDPKVQSRRLVEIANAHKVPFSVMEPNKGGWLASEVSENGKYLKSLHPDVSNASLAFRYVLELEGLFVCLSGMGNMDELEDNIKTFANYTPLTGEERTHIAKAVDIIHSYPNIPCTGCAYCMPNCPKKIQIPHFMDLYNKYLKYKNLDTIRHLHFMHTSKGKPGPAACVKCGVCASHCPQHLDIPDVMTEFTKLLVEE
ncbi:MAG: aldo/keto reductase, partial [Oscillospiraceae bacterium]|nr:aldo/keto reductase [Oscillospiraceae bacterium]